jgi:hypothetical protein
MSGLMDNAVFYAGYASDAQLQSTFLSAAPDTFFAFYGPNNMFGELELVVHLPSCLVGDV